MQHYHIQWGNSKLDWQAFKTEDEAEKEAEQLKRPDEEYSIVKRDGECAECMDTQRKMTGRTSR